MLLRERATSDHESDSFLSFWNAAVIRLPFDPTSRDPSVKHSKKVLFTVINVCIMT